MNIMTLQETLPFEYKIVEKRGQTKRDGVLLRLEGTLQRADTPNANKRVYPKTLWNKIMQDEGVNDRLGTRRMLGELDHPSSGSTSLNRVSHVITEHALLPDGRVVGGVDVLNTPSGQIAATLFEAGVQLGISSRGDGSVQKKGDLDEVQDDFRLETYDLVLKPSTPGAYPQIAESEEAIRENAELIASAVEGLVNSTSDVDVLLECHKIITLLDGCDQRRDSIITKLKEKLGGDGSQQQPQSISKPNESTEDARMNTNNVTAPSATPPGLNLSPEMKDFLQEWVNKGVSEAVSDKEQEISALHEQVTDLSRVRTDLETRLEAAEELIEGFTYKVKELSENATTDEELSARYDASVRLLDEALNKLQELGESKRRLHAAESLLAASITRHQESTISDTINSVVGDLDEAHQEAIRPILESCSSVEEVQERFEQLSGLIESAPATIEREPLPTPRRQISEGAPKPAAVAGDMVTSRLLSRVHGASV